MMENPEEGEVYVLWDDSDERISAFHLLLSNSHIAQAFVRLNHSFFFTSLFPWEKAMSENPSSFVTFFRSTQLFKDFMGSPSSFINSKQFHEEFLTLFEPHRAEERSCKRQVDDLLYEFYGFSAEKSTVDEYSNVCDLICVYISKTGDKRRKVKLPKWHSTVPRILTPDAPRESYYRRRHELKSVVHWGQRKLLLSEIEFLTIFSAPGDVLVYAGAAPGRHIRYIAELFPDVYFVLIDPCDFLVENMSANGRILLLDKTYFTDSLAQYFSSSVQSTDSKAETILLTAKRTFDELDMSLRKQRHEKMDVLLDVLSSVNRKWPGDGEVSKLLCGTNSHEDLDAWLDCFIPGVLEDVKYDGCSGRLERRGVEYLRRWCAFSTRHEREKAVNGDVIRKKEECRKQFDENIRNLEYIKTMLEDGPSGESRILFVSDVRSASPGQMHEDEIERMINDDMENQQSWVQIMKPKQSLLKFRLSYKGGVKRYMNGMVRLPVWSPQTTTETRFVPIPSDGSVMKDWDAREYEEQMFYFNTVTRTSFYENQCACGIYDNCFDCASEVQIIRSYLKKACDIPNSEEETMTKAIQWMCSEIDKEITLHGKRTICSSTRKPVFKTTTHTTDVREFVPHSAYEMATGIGKRRFDADTDDCTTTSAKRLRHLQS